MKKFLVALIAVVAVANAGTVLAADELITFEVTAIREMAIPVGAVNLLLINSATAGLQPDDALGQDLYNITNNLTSKIMAKIDSAMPANTSLAVDVAAVGGGTSTQVTLTAVDQDAVTGIGPVASAGNALDYIFSATVAAGVVPSFTRTVTYTLTAP